MNMQTAFFFIGIFPPPAACSEIFPFLNGSVQGSHPMLTILFYEDNCKEADGFT
jgi:hypothetical protein